MSIINAADSLMGIFGYTRVKCAYCVFSIGTDKADMYCEYHGELVKPDSQCEEYMRETQGDAFAQQVKAKVVQAGKARTK